MGGLVDGFASEDMSKDLGDVAGRILVDGELALVPFARFADRWSPGRTGEFAGKSPTRIGKLTIRRILSWKNLLCGLIFGLAA